MPFRTFQLHQSFQLRVPSCQAGTVHPILSLPESFEEILTFLIPCLLGNLYDGKTCFFRRVSSCPLNSLIAHFQILTVFLVFQHSFAASSKATSVYLPQNFLPPLLTENFAAASASSSFFRCKEGPLPLSLHNLCLANPFATFITKLPSLLGAPTNASCVPPNGQFPLVCCEELENPAPSPFCMRRDVPQADLGFFCDPSAAPKPQSPLSHRRFFQVFSHCSYHLSFLTAPDTPLLFQIRLPLSFVRRRERNLLQRRRRHSSSGIRRRFYWSHFLASTKIRLKSIPSLLGQAETPTPQLPPSGCHFFQVLLHSCNDRSVRSIPNLVHLDCHCRIRAFAWRRRASSFF